ncbi:hypothetical protein M405DRAFT_862202 [Rhizopogon salebrosus TDB-379]|nr:hypothetical protein M405DRAFT_862202 [Rhizopogon salebrosus TDB-379]
MSSQGVPSPAELENLGVFFVGFIAATFLYGVTFFQSYIYYSRYPNDSRWIKVLVCPFCLSDDSLPNIPTLPQILSYPGYRLGRAGILLDVLLSDSDVLRGNGGPIRHTNLLCRFTSRMTHFDCLLTLCHAKVQGLLASILTLITQLFFAGRLYTVCGGPASITSKMVALVVCCLAFVSFVFGLISAGQTFQQRELSAFASHPMAVVAGVSQGFATAAYILISIAMCWALRPRRYPDMPMLARRDDGYNQVVALSASRPFGLTLIQLACFGAFLALPTQAYWIALQMVTCRVCVNTLIGILNTRKVKRGVGVHIEESVSETQDSTNDGLPTLRFRLPTATKTQTQHTRTLNFTTGIGIESGGTGTDTEEASKSCRDDEHLSSIRSQCSEQPEDKTRLSSEQAV